MALNSPRKEYIARWFDVGFKYWALIPLFIILLLFTVYPFAELLRMSVSTLSLSGGRFIWAYSGLANLYKVLADKIFIIALKNTLIFVIATVGLELILGLGLALVANTVKRMANFYRAILILPILVPPIAISTVWRLMYNPNFGLINALLQRMALPGQTWLSDIRLAMVAVIAVDVWHWTSYVFLILLAGLQALPSEPFEAAKVDGASDLHAFLYVTLPLLKPTIAVAVMFRTLYAFKVFDEIFLLTSGGPGTATEVTSTYIYRVFFNQYQMGYGAFLSILVIAVVMMFILTYQRMLRREGV
ncbi:MAG: sugar ABC transporter permease [Firmicutes bacterium]|nr:sugar ABC transporter permease [Bacillota bacterium]